MEPSDVVRTIAPPYVPGWLATALTFSVNGVKNSVEEVFWFGMLNDRNCFASEMLTPNGVYGLAESTFNNCAGAGETRERLDGVTIRVDGPESEGAVTVSVTVTLKGEGPGGWMGQGNIE